MREWKSELRRTGIVLACALSVALGLTIAWRFVTPQSLGRTTTGELLAIFGLAVLPALTIIAWIFERRSPRRIAEAPPDAPAPPAPADSAQPSLPSAHSPAPTAAPSALAAAPSPPGRAAGDESTRTSSDGRIHPPGRRPAAAHSTRSEH